MIIKGKFHEFDKVNRSHRFNIGDYYHLFTKMTRRKIKIKRIFNE